MGSPNLVDCDVAAIFTCGKNQSPAYAALDTVTAWTLTPSIGPDNERIDRLAMFRMRIVRGRICGRRDRWWTRVSLAEERDTGLSVAARNALALMDDALQRRRLWPLGADLPIYFNTSETPIRSHDVEVLELDIVRAIRGDFAVHFKVKNQEAADALLCGLMDVARLREIDKQHDVLQDMMEQLIERHRRVIGAMVLVPCRWISDAVLGDPLVALTATPVVMRFTDPAHAAVRVGCIDFVLRCSSSALRNTRRRKRAMWSGQRVDHGQEHERGYEQEQEHDQEQEQEQDD